eukprot:RCo003452
MPTVYVDARLPTIASFILLVLSWIFGIVSASAKGWSQYVPAEGSPEIRAGLWWWCSGSVCTGDIMEHGCTSQVMAARAFIVLAIMSQGLAAIGLVAVTGFQKPSFTKYVMGFSALTIFFSLFPWLIWLSYHGTCASGDKELGLGWFGSLLMFLLSLGCLLSVRFWRRSLTIPAVGSARPGEHQIVMEV